MLVVPSLDQVLAHQGPETHFALSSFVLIDGETPISLFHKLAADRPGAFLLESVEGGELMGRYSFMGFDLHRRLELLGNKAILHDGQCAQELAERDPLDAIRAVLQRYNVWSAPELPRLQGGLVGYLGFDCMAMFENVSMPVAGPSFPDACLLLADRILIYDHVRHRLIAVVHEPFGNDREASYQSAKRALQDLLHRVLQPAPALPPWSPPEHVDVDALPLTPSCSPDQYQQAVRQAQQAIVAGEAFQVVLSQKWTVQASLPPFEIYRSLRSVNPSPYMFYLRFDDFAVVGASPEVLVRLDGSKLLVRPIAGTRPRGNSPQQDTALADDLLGDEKELAEHRMLIDLGRNDLGRVGAVGSVRVDSLMHIERYSHVMHIVSDVHAQLAPGCDALDALRACFPAGTVSGAPKIRACDIISRLEPERRGIYAGAVGYFDFAGNMDTCIAIRTLVVERDRIHAQAGAGIVFDSVPEREHLECLNKVRASLTAVALTAARLAGGGEP